MEILKKIWRMLRGEKRKYKQFLFKPDKEFRDGELVIAAKVIQRVLPNRWFRWLKVLVLPDHVSLKANWLVVPIDLGEINESSKHLLAEELRKLELTSFRVKRKSLMIEPREIVIESLENIWETTEEVAQLLFEWKKTEDKARPFIETLSLL